MVVIHPAIAMSLGVCSILLVYVMFEEHIGKWISQGIVGCIVIGMVNYVVPSYIAVTFNIWTVLIACLMGIPGVALLYGWQFLEHFYF
ncbi:MAG: pro-sigmaK processing inhibitor BofA family protein [Cellulosilyticaceae bacterium]